MEIQANRKENLHRLRIAQLQASSALTTKLIGFGGVAIVAVLTLFWLFLHYGKTEQVFNLIAILATGGGGVGVGIGLKGRGGLVSPPPTQD